MENLDCNQIKIFINLKIIGEEDKNKKKIISIFLNLKKKNCNLVKPHGITTASKPNFYYIVYVMMYSFLKSLFFPTFSRYKYSLAYFPKKLNKLFSNEH